MTSYLVPSNTYAGKTALFGSSDPITWSTFEAISNVNINEYNLSNIDVLDALEIMAVSTISSNILVENINAGNIISSNLKVNNLTANISVTGNLNVVNIHSGNIETSNISTLSGTMIMRDENGNLNLLHAISSNLYFNNELLAKAGDVQNVADWALYAAVADIDADNRPIINAISIDTSSTIKSELNVGDINADAINIGVTNTAKTKVFDLEAVNQVTPNVIVDTATKSVGTVGQYLSKDLNNVLAWTTPAAPSTAVTSIAGISNVVTLTSTDNSVTITPSGQNINLQANTGGSVANWSNYGAVSDVNFNNYTIKAGVLPITADNGTSTDPSTVNISTTNGLYGNIGITANSGQILGQAGTSGGLINITANGGNNVLTGDHGKVSIIANPGTAGTLSTGGLVEITANSGFNDVTLTSAIKFSAAGINSYAGAIPSIGSVAGYNFIYGTGGVNISAGLPAAFPNIPGTVYIYGTSGVEVNSTLYTTTIRPYWDGSSITAANLTIQGRSLPAALVNLRDINYMYMGGDGAITGLTSINGIPYPPAPTIQTGIIPYSVITAATWTSIGTFGQFYADFTLSTLTLNSNSVVNVTMVNIPTDGDSVDLADSCWIVATTPAPVGGVAGSLRIFCASNPAGSETASLEFGWIVSSI